MYNTLTLGLCEEGGELGAGSIRMGWWRGEGRGMNVGEGAWEREPRGSGQGLGT